MSKKPRAKWTGDVAQVVEQLLCKCETRVQLPVPPKKKKKKEWIIMAFIL
jgi:hypothetical protein